jgi:citrate synthase
VFRIKPLRRLNCCALPVLCWGGAGAWVSLRRALRLKPGSALALFAIGRTAGWIAHALEQQTEDKVIRPRARYTGPAPAPQPEVTL